MSQLWWVSAVIVVLMLLSLWRVLSRQTPGQDSDRLQMNRDAFREREAEIERQFAAGELNAEEKSRLSNENARQLLNEASLAHTAGRYSDRIPVFAFMTTILLGGSLALYSWLGAHQQVSRWIDLQQSAERDPQHQKSMQEMLLLLRTRLQHDPEDSEGWYMLGSSMLSLEQAQLAVQAFKRAHVLAPNEPDVIVAYARALRMADPESSGPEVDRLLQQARLLDTEHEGAVLMTAYRHFEKGEFTEAIPLFEKLKVGRARDSEALKMLDASIQRAREGLAARGIASPQPVTSQPVTSQSVSPGSGRSTPTGSGTAVSGDSITVTVDLAANAKKAVSADARVFIYARAMQGPPMPLAVVTTTVAQLPITVNLSDANAMNAALKLSGQQDVQLIARVSRTGNANATPGDWQGDLNIVNWRKNNTAHVTIQKQL